MGIDDIFKKLAAGREPAPTGPVEYIIVGLGNPGTQYENTRHNAGFMTIDTLSEDIKTDVKKIKFKSLVGDCTIGGKHCLLIKPSTFMNNSGEAVVEADKSPLKLGYLTLWFKCKKIQRECRK